MAPVASDLVRRRVWIIAPAEATAPASATIAPIVAPDGAARSRKPSPQLLGQHHDDADEADRHRRPAIDAHRLEREQRGQDDDDQRRREGEGGRGGERQQRQRDEIGEHAARADQRAPDMAERPAGMERGRKFAARGEPADEDDQREQRAEQHDLADGIAGRDRLDDRRHQRKDESATLRAIPRTSGAFPRRFAGQGGGKPDGGWRNPIKDKTSAWMWDGEP